MTERIHSRGLKNAAFALLLALGWSGAAYAHVFPRTQVPPAGATVSSPAQVRIVFDGPLEPAFSTVTVTDAGGKPVNTAKARIDAQDADAISVALPTLQAGKYTVHWVAVASDGHRTHGDYSFEVK
ncbi:copper resistance protein CopC [Caballeronia sp. Lep1P3]|uniref:copper resistance CopC family protein n=1 Tax=Caballeronia sp. Lep1P3 TaxID=2878150 RepID=UPI001FD1C0D5|nr:copper resistance protein CopC [Caballeronia sp. Lep1P3]